MVKYIGITPLPESGHAERVRVMKQEKPDSSRVNYSFSAPQAVPQRVPRGAGAGRAIMSPCAFANGRPVQQGPGRALPGWAGELGVTSWAQMFLKFTLSHPAVTVVIPATGKPHRQADNLRAGTGALLDATQQKELLASFA